jgi:hypothetical protein
LAAKPPKPTKKLLGAAKPPRTPPPEADFASALPKYNIVRLDCVSMCIINPEAIHMGALPLRELRWA